MTSIYQQALGSDFNKLHPQIQRRFALTSASGLAAIGTGTMDRLWHGPNTILPFLYIGAWRSIMFPEQGTQVPFTIENYAYRDPLGRETVSWVRTFNTARPRRFDAYMIWSPTRNLIVDYLGTHQHLAVDLDISVAENGGVRIRSGEQRFYEGPVAFRFPMLFSGIADVCEWYDDTAACFRIVVNVTNSRFGPTLRLLRPLPDRVAPSLAQHRPNPHPAQTHRTPRVATSSPAAYPDRTSHPESPPCNPPSSQTAATPYPHPCTASPTAPSAARRSGDSPRTPEHPHRGP